MTEFEIIDRFVARFARGGAGVVAGPGDDCAVVRVSSGSDLVLKTDAVVQGRHFYFPGFSAEDVGWKALAVNLSDLAAAGAEPRWFLCAVAAPRDAPARVFGGLARGMDRLARRAGVALVGGNLTAADQLSVTIAIAGEVPRGTALGRGGAQPGDRIYVSGELGEARVGLIRMQAGARRDPAFGRQRRPWPRLRLGRLARRYAHASCDISDGFPQDLGHILERSRVGAVVEVGRLPVSPAVARCGIPIEVALTGGEDYELIHAVSPRRAAAFEAACRRIGEKVTCVGEFVRGRGAHFSRGGRPVKLAGGYRHF